MDFACLFRSVAQAPRGCGKSYKASLWMQPFLPPVEEPFVARPRDNFLEPRAKRSFSRWNLCSVRWSLRLTATRWAGLAHLPRPQRWWTSKPGGIGPYACLYMQRCAGWLFSMRWSLGRIGAPVQSQHPVSSSMTNAGLVGFPRRPRITMSGGYVGPGRRW